MNNKLKLSFGIILLVFLFSNSSNAQQTVTYDLLGDANDPGFRRYEIARIYVDAVNWNWSGTCEIDLHEKYFSAGLKKQYIVSYGYGVPPVLYLKDMSGEGANHFKVSLGSEVTVSGSIRYLPIYIDVTYYSLVNVALRTNWYLTPNSANTSQGYLYYNTSPSYTNSGQFIPDETVHLANRAARVIFNRNVGIGTSTPVVKLSVNGMVRAKEVKVEHANWPDYVFDEGYRIDKLEDLENYIKINKHLPGIPTAKEIEKDGVSLGEMNAKLLQKIEEMTMQMIEMNKEINDLKKRVNPRRSKNN